MIPTTRRTAASALAREMSAINTLVRLWSQGRSRSMRPGIADDQHGQQPDDQHQEEPRRIAIAQLVRQCRPEQARGDHGDRHGPARLAEASLLLVRRSRADGHGAIFPHAESRTGYCTRGDADPAPIAPNRYGTYAPWNASTA